MKKALIIVILLLSFGLWQIVDIFLSVQADKRMGLSEQIQIVRQETGLTITDVRRFHGKQLYYVFTGHDPVENEYSYISLNENQDIAQILFADIEITKEMAVSLALQEFKELKEISRVIPAYVNNQFVWEIIGYDQEDSLQYIYYIMKEGSFLKRYKVDPFIK